MVKNESAQITISKELKAFIISLTREEIDQLEKNLLIDGCREPLIVWQVNNKLVLIDGHNRYKICKEHSIPFKIRKRAFSSIEEVKCWMVDNQMGRRNLTSDQLSYYRGLKYLALRHTKGGYESVKSKGQNEPSTSEILSDQFNVSESTVKRDAKFAAGLDIIGKSNPQLRFKILTGGVKVKKADIRILANAKHKDRIVIKNEADLYNKAKKMRDEILNEVENKVQRLENEKIKRAREIFNDSPPEFLTRDERLNRIKGMIISAINRAIQGKDTNPIRDIKKLIGRLEDELFE